MSRLPYTPQTTFAEGYRPPWDFTIRPLPTPQTTAEKNFAEQRYDILSTLFGHTAGLSVSALQVLTGMNISSVYKLVRKLVQAKDLERICICEYPKAYLYRRPPR